MYLACIILLLDITGIKSEGYFCCLEFFWLRHLSIEHGHILILKHYANFYYS